VLQCNQQPETCKQATRLQTGAGKGSENQNPTSRTKAITSKKQAGKVVAHPAA